MTHITTLTDAIYEGIKRTSNDKPRQHLGASSIGAPCDRKLWFDFRWIMREEFDGRILRLFRRGQDEETPLIKDLRNAGLKIDAVNPTTKKQFGFMDGHFGGSCDGIITAGVPDAPHKQHVLEIKTSSDKAFKDMVKNGVEKSKPQHWAQMQIYMGKLEIDRALYVMVNKDNDDIYTERVRFDKDAYEALCDRAQRIIASDLMPHPLSADPSWFECKFCSAHPICHKAEIQKEVHCRTCSNVTFERDGRVRCEKYECDIPFENQMQGCEGHILHPDLVPWPMRDSDIEGVAVWEIEGKMVSNGEPNTDVFSSAEILANPKACANMDKFTRDCRMELDGRVGKNEI